MRCRKRKGETDGKKRTGRSSTIRGVLAYPAQERLSATGEADEIYSERREISEPQEKRYLLTSLIVTISLPKGESDFPKKWRAGICVG